MPLDNYDAVWNVYFSGAMERKKFNDAIRSLVAKTMSAAQAAVKSFETEHIHRFRVCYKRLRAWTELLDHCNQEDSGKKLIRKLKPLYRSFGTVRTCDLLLGLIHSRENTRLNACENVLTLRREAAISTAEHAFAKLQHHISIPRLHKTSENASASFISKQIAAFEHSIAHPANADQALHTCRKKVKKIGYLLEWYNRLPDDGSNPPAFEADTYKKLGDLIGQYHDLQVGIQFLSEPAVNAVTGKEERALCDRLAQQLEAELTDNLQQVHAVFTSLLSQRSSNQNAMA
jgi:CHAD domain-containing protein